jgi:hypothetical protein
MADLIVPASEMPPPMPPKPHPSLILRNLTLIELSAREAREAIAQADLLQRCNGDAKTDIVNLDGQRIGTDDNSIAINLGGLASTHIHNIITVAGMLARMTDAKP